MTLASEIWLSSPAKEWSEAFPIGNGRLGAMVFGRVEIERIALNDDTLWSGEPVPLLGISKSDVLDEIRSLVFEGRFAEADRVCKKLQGPYTQSYLPIGDLELRFLHEKEASSYRRSLDIADAIATISYTVGDVTFTRQHFVSAPDNALVVKIVANQPGTITLSVSLTSQLRSQASAAGSRITLTGKAPKQVVPSYVTAEVPVTYDEVGDGEGMRFASIVDIATVGGTLTAYSDTVHVMDADEVVITLAASTSFNGFDRSPSSDGRDELALATKAADFVSFRHYEQIVIDHIADYRRYYDRVTLDLGGSANAAELPTDIRLANVRAGKFDPALEALYFQFGRYLLISSSRPGTIAANLQGIWNEDVRPPWSSNFTININTQMNYWLAEVANLAELASPLFDLIDNLTFTGSNTSDWYYNARGWCAHHNSDIWALSNPVGAGAGDACWANWPMGGAWLAQHLWEHYMYGENKDFLEHRAYPVLKGVATFLVDFLVESPAGYLETCPSTSPENEFFYTDETGTRLLSAVSSSTTMDIALIREVFTNTIASAKLIGTDAEFSDTLSDMLTRLRPYVIGPEGQLLEWPYPVEAQEKGHRHISHLYGAHPGYDITRTKTPELASAVKKSLELRLANGGGHTGWSRAWLVNQYARLGEAELAHQNVVALLASYTFINLLDSHPPFQIDGNLGGAAGIAEMLLQSHDGFVELLPALPVAWTSGSVTGFRARGGLTVSIAWSNSALTSAKIAAQADGNYLMRYRNMAIKLSLSSGKPVTIDLTHFSNQ